VPEQLARVERRQRRIKAIRENVNGSSSQKEPKEPEEDLSNGDPGLQYNMGQSQKFPVHIPTFLQRNEGDPAVKHFLQKLREHLLPRIQAAHLQEAASFSEHPSVSTPANLGSSASVDGNACDLVFFKKDCLYHHKLLRFNFTTYDVRRGTDIVNPGTSRCNVMLLADHEDGSAGSPNPHHFLYARVLGAYHANVIYTGPGMQDYEARRFDFLWVRWFEVVDSASSGWASSTLDSVRFPPMHGTHSFGFVDPKDVLRGCHILPAFAKGKRHTNGVGISRCAKDGKDYKLYYVGRFSDRDLLMRYHWGLGVGHLHAHHSTSTSACISDNRDADNQADESADPEPCELGPSHENAHLNLEAHDTDSDLDKPELGLDDRDPEGWEDVETDGSEGYGNGEHDSKDIDSEEDFVGM
jgi:hypothetical protein